MLQYARAVECMQLLLGDILTLTTTLKSLTIMFAVCTAHAPLALAVTHTLAVKGNFSHLSRQLALQHAHDYAQRYTHRSTKYERYRLPSHTPSQLLRMCIRARGNGRTSGFHLGVGPASSHTFFD